MTIKKMERAEKQQEREMERKREGGLTFEPEMLHSGGTCLDLLPWDPDIRGVGRKGEEEWPSAVCLSVYFLLCTFASKCI